MENRTNCIHCGKKLKPGKQRCECRGCNMTKIFVAKGLASPQYAQKEAIKHLSKKGHGLLSVIFGI
jgi:hypothetical protein